MISLVLALALAGAEAASPPPVPVLPAPSHPLPSVVWNAVPSPEAILAAYPKEARELGESARVTMNCALARTVLRDCAVVASTATGLGVEQAALSLTSAYRSRDPDRPVTVAMEWVSPAYERALEAATRGDFAELDPVTADSATFARRPDADDIARFYPPAAERAELGGSATLICMIDVAGVPSVCQVLAEEPAGMGFGEAAVSVAKRIRYRAADAGSAIAGRTIQLPLAFRVP